MKITRPVLRYFGGKFVLAPRIIEHFPKHRIYVEPFGGAASVLLRKAPAYAEIYNDLDGELVGLFRVLRDPAQAARLIAALELTPFARDEFEAAYQPTDDPVEEARRLMVRSFMGHGSTGTRRDRRTGFRADARFSNTSPAHDWASFPPSLQAVVERLRPVVIENRPALSIIERFDRPDTLFYVDPPYPWDTRSDKSTATGTPYHGYTHEMVVADHEALLDRLLAAAGMVVISGYPYPLYDERLVGWRRVELRARADRAVERVEVLWINPRAAALLEHQPKAQALFEDAG